MTSAAMTDASRAKPVLVLGLPRSGTTWTAQMLACAPGTVAVMEPDNEKAWASAVAGKAPVGRFPVLAPGDDAPAYRDLWTWALSGGSVVGLGHRGGLARRLFEPVGPDDRETLVSGHPSVRLRLAGHLGRPPHRPVVHDGSRVVAKSVHGGLAAEWLADTFDVDVVVVLRHPANVLASWLDLDLPDRDRHLDENPVVRERYLDQWKVPPPGPDPLDRAVWQLGLLTTVLEEAADRHPSWRIRVHEELCADPEGEFRRLFTDLDLAWSPSVVDELARGNRPGEGFSLQRRTAELAEAWRTRLGPAEKAALERGLAPFPLKRWSWPDINGDVSAR
jgi:hypothetical protein